MSSAAVTRLLNDLSAGRREAMEELLPLVYADLRQRARGYMRGERAGHTLQPTALVHEAFLKLVNQRDANWQNRAHFLAIASQAMRRILVDHARTHGRAKRGGGQFVEQLDEDALAIDTDLCSAKTRRGRNSGRIYRGPSIGSDERPGTERR